MRTFGFLAEKTRFRSSLMAHEFVLDLSNCSGPQNTQVSLSETLQMFHFKGSCTQLGEAPGQSSPQKHVATPWLQPLLKQPALGWCFLHYHASALLQSTLISSQHFFASKKSAIRASGEHPVIQRGELMVDIAIWLLNQKAPTKPGCSGLSQNTKLLRFDEIHPPTPT